ncbi:MAG: sigma-70 family RNA polymerase sigma factor [Myxococcota bacterium]|nr:sigma-70 family RNA polymerase sigma factor [Myxococcota bacterium]
MPDRDLDTELSAIARGDAAAFARWLGAAEHELRRSLRPVAAWVDTEAVLQEGLLRLWQVAPRFTPDGRPNGLLRMGVTICRNLATSELRRHRPEVSAEEITVRIRLEQEAISPEQLPDPLLRRVIALCRAKLPRKPAEALAARLESIGGDDDETLAARLGMKLNTFLQNFTRARKLLAQCLGKNGVRLEEL